MGFFGKVKQNLNHGGVKVEVVAPDQIPKDHTNIHVQANLYSNENRAIKAVYVEVQRQYHNNASSNKQRQPSVLGSAKYTTPFNINAGQPLSLQFDVSIAPVSETDSNSAMGNVFGALEKMNNAIDKNTQLYSHQIVVTADVDGIAMDPKGHKTIVLDGLEMSGWRGTGIGVNL